MINMRMLRIFISYSHKDNQYRQELEEHLSSLKRRHIIEVWSDCAIELGQEWEKSISEKLKTSDIILLLISSSFINSEFIYEKELTQAMKRHDADEAQVIPIFLRPCDWKNEVFAKLQGVPDKPISQWENRDEAFTIVVRAIRGVAEVLASKIEGKNAGEWFDLGRKAFDLADKEHDLDKYEEAKKCYYKALELNPNDSIKQAIAGDLEKIMNWNLFFSLLAGIPDNKREEAMDELLRFTDEYHRKKSK